MIPPAHPQDLAGLAGAMGLDLTAREQDVLAAQLAGVVEAVHRLPVARETEPALIYVPGKGLGSR